MSVGAACELPLLYVIPIRGFHPLGDGLTALFPCGELGTGSIYAPISLANLPSSSTASTGILPGRSQPGGAARISPARPFRGNRNARSRRSPAAFQFVRCAPSRGAQGLAGRVRFLPIGRQFACAGGVLAGGLPRRSGPQDSNRPVPRMVPLRRCLQALLPRRTGSRSRAL